MDETTEHIDIEVYKAVFETWRWQVNSYWQRSSYFAVFETAALGGFCYIKETSPAGGALLAIFGILLTLVWSLNNEIVHGYVGYWKDALIDAEKKLKVNHFANVCRQRQQNGDTLPYHGVVQTVPILFLVAWVLLYCSLCSMPRP